MIGHILRAKETGLVIVVLTVTVILIAMAGTHQDRTTGEVVNNFWNSYTLVQLGTDASFFAIMALGATLVIISGGIDLSVGSTYALAGVATALLLRTLGPLSGSAAASVTLMGCLGVGLHRASLFGRAPIIHDLDIAYRVWGFLGDAPPELVTLRAPLFEAASHHYWDQRAIVDRVPESTLRLSHQTVASRFPADWRDLISA